MATSIDYRVEGTVGGGQPGLGPRFDASMPDNGYLWWYVDGLSDDGRYGFTIIAFIGSVFSPYYKWARYRRPTDPAEHSCMHVVLYGPDRRRWAMTERPSGALNQSSHRLEIGPSAMTWEDGCLTVDIDERCAPLPRSLRGRIRLFADCVYDRASYLDPEKAHRWWPINPSARVEVALSEPDLNWKGEGYFDSNDGDIPLEDSFRSWNWSRGGLADGGAAILYDVVHKSGTQRHLALRFNPDGSVSDFSPECDLQSLGKTRWLVSRESRCQKPASPKILKTLVDSPFYSRSVLSTTLLGEPLTAMHESLDMRRFVSPIVQVMLPFRVFRRRFAP